MTERLPFLPVIILGAGRSGTNVLRDMLTALPGFATWPCDEIQPIWRHGNVRWPDDEIPAERATPAVRRFVRRAFLRLWERSGRPRFVVEKTCANTLRVPFVATIMPEARYIQIVRHGADVVRSAEKRWRGEIEVPQFSYYISKARVIPPADIPVYCASFISRRAGLLARRRMSAWGPRFRGLDDLADAPLPLVCAKQWAACTARTAEGLGRVPAGNVMTTYYENLVTDPAGELSTLLDFLGAEAGDSEIAAASSIVRQRRTDRGPREIADGDVRRVLRPQLIAHGYAA